MNLNGNLPRLTDADALYAVKTYSEHMANALEGTWESLTLASGWSTVAGYPLQIRKYGRIVEVRGMVKFASGLITNNVVDSLPIKYRPTGQAAILPTSMGTNSKAHVTFFVFAAGHIAIPGSSYYSGSPNGNDLYPLRGFWSSDNV